MALPPLPNNRTALPVPPPEPPEVKPIGSLTEDEVGFIFDQYLLPSQRQDPKVIKFISNYVRSRNAAQSAVEAGFNSSQGYTLRQRPEIHRVIEAITEKALMKYGYDATEVIERVKEIAAIDPIEFENPDGSFKTHLSQIAPESRRAIKRFKCKNIFGKDPNGMAIVIGQMIEVEMWDKMKAVELLGREKNIFKETKKIEHDVTANMAQVLLDSSKRADQRALPPTIDVTPVLTGEIVVEESNETKTS